MITPPRLAARLAARGLELPPAPPPKGAYLAARRWGDQLWISGATARRPEAPALRGVVGADVTVEVAREQAGLAALNLLAAIAGAAALEDVAAVLQLRGYVRGTPDFEDHPAVLDGASDVLLEAFGADAGRHARTAIGVASLPGGACVEVDLVVSLAAAAG